MTHAPNLFFIGPMGAGKTTIGRHVAELLNLEFYDLDQVIEMRSGVDISLIFELEGEAGFRRRETALLIELANKNAIALATGGGTILSAENRAVLKQRGFVVYLESSVDKQLFRLKRDRRRPLLQADTIASEQTSDTRRDRLQRLALERNPLYREIADITISADGQRSALATAQRVVTLLNTHWQPEMTALGHQNG